MNIQLQHTAGRIPATALHFSNCKFDHFAKESHTLCKISLSNPNKIYNSHPLIHVTQVHVTQELLLCFSKPVVTVAQVDTFHWF